MSVLLCGQERGVPFFRGARHDNMPDLGFDKIRASKHDGLDTMAEVCYSD